MKITNNIKKNILELDSHAKTLNMKIKVLYIPDAHENDMTFKPSTTKKVFGIEIEDIENLHKIMR